MAEQLKVTLSLKWQHGTDYEAEVAVQLPDDCFHYVDLKAGLPPGAVGLPEIQYLTATITRDVGRACAEHVTNPSKKINIASSEGKQKVTANAVLNDKIVGSDTKPFPR
jgi:hypothetical protein